ncbi:MAG: hypothetical protein R2879_13355 [Saprospiraceae bacterium]
MNEVVILPEEADRILSIYKEKGWFDEMKTDLEILNIDSNHLVNWVKGGPERCFNVKFKASQLKEIPLDVIPFLLEEEIKMHRYTLMDLPKGWNTEIEENLKLGFHLMNLVR